MSRPVLFSIFFLCALPATQGWAQRLELGAGLGAMMYKGDLSDIWNPLQSRPVLTGLLKYNLSYATALRANLSYGGLKGDGANSSDLYIRTQQPNTFRTPLFEFAGGLEYNFMPWRDPLQKRLRGSPFLYGGFGVFYYQPGNYEKRQVTPIQPCIPLAIGYKYRLSKNLNLAAEAIFRYTFTDLLDDASTIDKKTGWQRGFRTDNDWYACAQITLSYTFYSVYCPFDYNAQ